MPILDIQESTTMQVRSIQLVTVGRRRSPAGGTHYQGTCVHANLNHSSTSHSVMATDAEPQSQTITQPKKRSLLKKFRIFALTITALQRWRKAINPTYVYGEGKENKRKEQEELNQLQHIMGKRSMSGPPGSSNTRDLSPKFSDRPSLSGRTVSGRPSSASKQGVKSIGGSHGNKSRILFNPLSGRKGMQTTNPPDT
ncbi:hypothetical protein CEUSTIGMA_g8069.t1 [Chlamydomonas eustigma]|uniref:Uncharacterized protein n=1 Tax=Chlamydomonas eustigma TaxID=1157962 RepID=A0A250XC26_9CHLO|nr:hypothetical protein CEUSTIGMA_g8069.t1 [Chlamydomonas eustigma]|eukprot:GAX80634.1 hypothetical protein CEUSTIGMA_g8069.t1 [Chlamydomonas eustigma]